MITENPDSSFTVVFPGDKSRSFKVEHETSGKICNRARWANIIEAASRQEFPDNDAGDRPSRGRPKIKTGLSVLTGKTANLLSISSSNSTQLEHLIEDCISRGNPAVLSTKSIAEISSLPAVILPSHAYALIGYDSKSKTLTLRNPLGDSVERQFANQAELDIANGVEPNEDACPLPLAGQERAGVKNLGDGLIRVKLATLKQYGRFISWSAL
ncbi:MAG TPA: hypothetical protein VFA15_02710 [Nitrososphaera sp.]|nr:hypothetical protein [Nitrososphaera sp.]